MFWQAGAQPQFVIASEGDTFENSNFILCQTIGEICTETFSSDYKILTQGFQQVNIVANQVYVIKDSDFEIKIFPNPANYFVNISTTAEENITMKYSLYDINGREIITDVMSSNLEQVNVSTLKSGTYFLRVCNTNQTYTYKILKTN